jgi:hypothetical protein
MGSAHSATGHHASVFEEKSNNPYKQGKKETKNEYHEGYSQKGPLHFTKHMMLVGKKYLYKNHVQRCHTPLSQTSVVSFSLSPSAFSECGSM